MYCLKCKKNTETVNEHEKRTKNNRLMLTGQCKICGTTKNKFISNKIKGGNLADTIIDKMPEMHLPYSLTKKYNYLGPFTKLNKRLDKNNDPLPGSEPINGLDSIALKHDLCYTKNKSFKDKNRICDKAMLDDLSKLKTNSLKELIDKKIAQGAITLKHVSGLGN